MELVTAPRILLADRLVGPGWVAIEGSTLVGCGAGSPPDTPTARLPRGVLAPGLVDMQLNGAFGQDVAAIDTDGWRALITGLPATGVTAFVPTVITARLTSMRASIERARRLRHAHSGGGARVLGLHVEGPFLAPGRNGAHPEEHLLDPTPEHLETVLDAGGSDLAYVTLAPELPGGMEAVADLVSAGVRVAVGHSDAHAPQVRAAVDAGATLVTHLYNGMRPLHHRDPGVVGAALADGRVTVGLIADLHHVDAVAIHVAMSAAPGRVALVTDAIAAMGMPAGDYQLDGEVITVREGGPPTLSDGTLAGSVLRLDEAVGNAVACGIDPAVALTAATRVPADALGQHDLGRLHAGTDADVVWLDDDWRAGATWVGGRLVHLDLDRLPADVELHSGWGDVAPSRSAEPVTPQGATREPRH